MSAGARGYECVNDAVGTTVRHPASYYQTRKWGLAQLRPSQCGGRSVDFNLTNDRFADYGQLAR